MNPENDYHFELTLKQKASAEFTVKILEEFNLWGLIIREPGTIICDFIMGAFCILFFVKLIKLDCEVVLFYDFCSFYSCIIINK